MYTISDLNKGQKHMTREERIAALKEELACLRTELRIKYKPYQRQFLFREIQTICRELARLEEKL